MGKASRGKRDRNKQVGAGRSGGGKESSVLFTRGYPAWSPSGELAALREVKVMQLKGDPHPMAVMVVDPPEDGGEWLPAEAGPTDAQVRWDFRGSDEGGHLVAVLSLPNGRELVSVVLDPWRDEDLLDCMAEGALLLVTDAENVDAIRGREAARGVLAPSSASGLAAARGALLADWPAPEPESGAAPHWDRDEPADHGPAEPMGEPRLVEGLFNEDHHIWAKPFVLQGWGAVLPRAASWLLACIAELEREGVRGDPRVLGNSVGAIAQFVSRYGGWDASVWVMEETAALTPPPDTELRRVWCATVLESGEPTTLRRLLGTLVTAGLIEVGPDGQWTLNPLPPAAPAPPAELLGAVQGATVQGCLLERSYDLGSAVITVTWESLAAELTLPWEQVREQTIGLLQAPHCPVTLLDGTPLAATGETEPVRWRIDWVAARLDGLVNMHDHLQLVHDGQPISWHGDALPVLGPRDTPSLSHIMGVWMEFNRAEDRLDEHGAGERLLEFCGPPAGMAKALKTYDAATLRRLAVGTPTPEYTARAEQIYGPVIWRQLSDLVDADLSSATDEGALTVGKPAPPARTPFGLPETFGSQIALTTGVAIRINKDFADPGVADDRLDAAMRPVFEHDMRVLTVGGRWGDPQQRTEPAAPGDAIALRALTLGAVIGQNALADSANGLRGEGIALDSRAYASTGLGAACASIGHALADAVPFYIPTATCAGVADSTPPQGEALDDIRLPFRSCLLALGAPLHLQPRSGLWHPRLAHLLETAPSGRPVDEAVAAAETRGQGLAINLASPPPPVPVVNAVYARGAFIDGLVLLADEDGQLADEVIWLLRIPGTSRTTLTRAALPGWRSLSTLADTVTNLAAALAWASWNTPEPTELPTRRPTATTARQERQGLLGGVRVLSLTRASRGDDAPREDGVATETGRRLSPHLRRGHWRRSRIGSRTDWDGTYRNAWIPPTVVNAALGSVQGQRVYRIPEPRTK
ncbi:hypothetical protein [Streptomyces sp. WM6378]|uniref:hypothetical protein n=1 Tax=Streptomyces sp. WM6378 TaxID=1415557 RepID=UPI000AFDFF8C|nr:hypothetical protein [Streptomyces sp. WM6378]